MQFKWSRFRETLQSFNNDGDKRKVRKKRERFLRMRRAGCARVIVIVSLSIWRKYFVSTSNGAHVRKRVKYHFKLRERRIGRRNSPLVAEMFASENRNRLIHHRFGRWTIAVTDGRWPCIPVQSSTAHNRLRTIRICVSPQTWIDSQSNASSYPKHSDVERSDWIGLNPFNIHDPQCNEDVPI